ncbi:P-loop containing nucleoside triphosphate hydrolase protein [Sporormia fimetaria CBS 119925]|uniref:P-loop containing nucleoside triphosphate hydrolase protein n=1 Tax=Sporormia fimetaria CBS 119925 TaxID=1340428 RepID=A0A6A6V7I6_9PLEO|nr:P-loop containing nucleoside triphosphate hydrolase protein [Sporormia fimetaria CBS 119925]
MENLRVDTGAPQAPQPHQEQTVPTTAGAQAEETPLEKFPAIDEAPVQPAPAEQPPLESAPLPQPSAEPPLPEPVDERKHIDPPMDQPADLPHMAQPMAHPVEHAIDHPVEQHPMETDDSMSSTMTASTVRPQPDFQSSSFPQSPHHRPQTSYSDNAYSPRYTHADAHYNSRFATSSDAEHTPPRHGYGRDSQLGRSNSQSRPSSTMGYRTQSEAGGSTYQDQNQRSSQPEAAQKNTSVVIKVGMVGDAQIGKTSLMVKYVEGSWDEDYIQTLGVNFMEKTISIRNTEITFSIWDLGGQREFVNMLPLVCNDAVAILFMFDLTRKSTLNSIKEWYRQGRGFNKTAIPFLVGTKYDHFVNFPREEQEEISNQAKRFAKAMKASLIFSSTSHSINVQKIFKIVLSKAFDLKCTIPEIENVGEPLLLYQAV